MGMEITWPPGMTSLCQLDCVVPSARRFGIVAPVVCHALGAVACISERVIAEDESNLESTGGRSTDETQEDGGQDAATDPGVTHPSHTDCFGGGHRCQDGVAYTLPATCGVAYGESCENGTRQDATICEYGCDGLACAVPAGGGAGGMGANVGGGASTSGSSSSAGAVIAAPESRWVLEGTTELPTEYVDFSYDQQQVGFVYDGRMWLLAYASTSGTRRPKVWTSGPDEAGVGGAGGTSAAPVGGVAGASPDGP